MPFLPLNASKTHDFRNQLHELLMGHRDLDQAITHLTENPTPDDLLIRRLKKRKLVLKDQPL